ncbi:MAG: aldo/keto reductase [Candidatus Omnitrophica bacterium]|nr:aldo/keto reductase [Candidatus Omnitrophota bacterium]
MGIDRRAFLKTSAAAAAIIPFVTGKGYAEKRNGMPYRRLGKTEEMVSLLCVGGYHIGREELTEQESIAIMRTAVDEGVNFFDNAWKYHNGRSEERMGKALKDGYRDKVFLMTKVAGRDAKSAQQQLEDSLRRLDVDVIDLWQCHEVVTESEPYKIYNEGVIEVLLKAKEEGKVRYLGFTGHRFPDIHNEMIERGFDWQTVQMPLNILDHHFRSFEQEILPKALKKDIGVIAMKTLGGTPGQIPAKAHLATVPECLRYAMSLPVSTVVSGMDSMDYLKQNIETAKNFTPMTEAERAELLGRTQKIALNGEFEPYKTEWS